LARSIPTKITHPITRIILIQLTVLLLSAGVSFLVMGVVTSYSVLLGGMICIIPSAYFAKKVFSQYGARAIENVVRNAYVGEFIKLALIGMGFSLAFVFVKPLDVPSLFAGFVLAHIIGIVSFVRLSS
jgi:ATP synthase protein I